MDSRPGTYALILRCRSRCKVQVGRWREIEVRPGYYVYVGSAFGPGGVRARVQRHFREDKSVRWHIDYLRHHVTPVGAWYSHDTDRLEHHWAGALDTMDGMSPVAGFGCSDCQCGSHLFHTEAAPDPTLFSHLARGMVETVTYRADRNL